MTADGLPPSIEPMRAVLGRDLPADDDRWAFEIKWDGMRAVVRVAAGRVRGWSASGNDLTARFPELAGLADELRPHEAVLDGELVAFDARGRPSFGALQPRIHLTADAAAEQAARTPVLYVVFDLLTLDGHDLTARTYDERRHLLEQLLGEDDDRDAVAWRLATSQVGGGADLLAAVRAQGLEGIVAKRRDSRYEPGRRSGAWRKIKIRNAQELVVGGWVPGEGGRASTFGALLVGYHPTSRSPALCYAGRVGTGFTDVELRRLRALLEARATDEMAFDPPPPGHVVRSARWVHPDLVVSVGFREWTAEGHLRHPSYEGQRVDKNPAEVVREEGP